ncbi:MAG: hypothetical protein IH991_17125 [Planctomycetes bacterium]|nr:hypothetical protein [Planctomycetota bacterium]
MRMPDISYSWLLWRLGIRSSQFSFVRCLRTGPFVAHGRHCRRVQTCVQTNSIRLGSTSSLTDRDVIWPKWRGREKGGFTTCLTPHDGTWAALKNARGHERDRQKVGVTIEGVRVFHLDQLGPAAAENKIKLGMIAVPASAAQSVADRLVAAGIEGIVNFAPMTITLPDHVRQVGVDLAIELEQLSFSIVSRGCSDGAVNEP